MRLNRFLQHIHYSPRLRTYVQGISLTWDLDAPFFQTLIHELISFVPKLSALRLDRFSIDSSREPNRSNDSYQLQLRYLSLSHPKWSSSGQAFDPKPAQDWLSGSLVLFSSIDVLWLNQIHDVSEKTANSQHLRVQRLHVLNTHATMFALLTRILMPGTITHLEVDQPFDWSEWNNDINVYNIFLGHSCTNLEHLHLHRANRAGRFVPPGESVGREAGHPV